MSSVQRFRYHMETLLSVRTHSRDLARIEEFDARKVVTEKEECATKVRETVAILEQQVRESLGAGSSLDLRQQEMMGRYLAATRERLIVILEELAQATNMHRQTLQSLQTHANRVRALERHRQTKKKQHLKAMADAEYKEQDELWLARIASDTPLKFVPSRNRNSQET